MRARPQSASSIDSGTLSGGKTRFGGDLPGLIERWIAGAQAIAWRRVAARG
jgi:hypothetical protein